MIDRGTLRPSARWTPAVPVLLSAGVLVAELVTSGWIRLTALYGLFAAMSFGYAALFVKQRSLTAAQVVVGSCGAGALLWASFPGGDVFVYAMTGKVWGTYHANPYVVAPAAFPDDPWQQYVRLYYWTRLPSPYGPLFLWQARIVDWFAAGRFFVAVWGHKLIAAAAFAATIVMATQLLRGMTSSGCNSGAGPAGRWWQVALLAWNPLLLYDACGQGHNDAFMMFSVIAALWSHRRGGRMRTLLAPTMLMLGMWYKWYALLFVPSFLIAVYRSDGGRAARRWLLVALLAGSGGLLLMPSLLETVPVLVPRFIGHENLRLGEEAWSSPVLAPLLLGLHALGLGEAWFDGIRLTLFALWVLAVLAGQWGGTLDLVRALCLGALGFFALVVAAVHSGHLEVPIMLALVTGTRRWQVLGVLLTLLGMLGNFGSLLLGEVLLAVFAIGWWALRRTVPVTA